MIRRASFASLVLTAALGAAGAAQSSSAARDSMYARYLGIGSLVRGGQVVAHWMGDGTSFWWADGAPDSTVIYRFDPRTVTKTPLFDVARVRTKLAGALGHQPAYRGLPFATFTWADRDEKTARITVEGREFDLRLADDELTALPPKSAAELARVTPQVVRKGTLALQPPVMELPSPDGRWLAGIKEDNLWLRSTADGRGTPVTEEGIAGYGFDLDGAKWSPDGGRLALKRIDLRKVQRYPIVHWLKRTEEVEWVPITKSGGALPQQELWLVDVEAKRAVRVNSGALPDQQLVLVAWRPDGTELLFTRADRTNQRVELLAADAKTGVTRLLVTDTSSTFVNNALPFIGNPGFAWVDRGRKFIWLAERDGWAHLFLYPADGGSGRPLTRGSFPVVRLVTVDEPNGWVYFTAHGDSKRPYDTHLYRVNLEGEGMKQLTEATGQHDLPAYLTYIGLNGAEGIQFSPSKAFFLDSHSTPGRPPVTELRRADGALVTTLAKSDPTGLASVDWHPPEEFTVKAADGVTDLYGVLYRPHDFDPAKRYPVIDNIYNGPQTTWVPRTFANGVGIGAQALAQLGFVVFVVDGRGTPERGKAFQDVVYGNFGRNEIPDHVAALHALAKERPYLDLSRVGVTGGSFGGYMTIRAMLLAPEVYHVGVARAPVVDLYDANVERYMGLPQDHRDAYEYGSSLRLAGNLRGHLLLIHGSNDINATFSATMKLVEAFTRAGRPYDLIVLPEQDHAMSGVSAGYASAAANRYLVEHLRPGDGGAGPADRSH